MDIEPVADMLAVIENSVKSYPSASAFQTGQWSLTENKPSLMGISKENPTEGVIVTSALAVAVPSVIFPVS
jgi:hypothetical protein